MGCSITFFSRVASSLFIVPHSSFLHAFSQLLESLESISIPLCPENACTVPFNAVQQRSVVFLICIHHWSQNIDLVFGNAFPVFVECDSGGYSILTDFHLGIMMLV